MFAQLNFCTRRFHAKLNSCQNFLLLNFCHTCTCLYNCVTIMAAIVSTEMNCVIIGYHVYKTVWTAILGEELECRRKVNNSVDRYAVNWTER